MRIPAFFVTCLILLWLGILVGRVVHDRRTEMVQQEGKIITVLEGALLTLFGLLMGFTFSMAVTRFDLRKELVVAEANSIETTWLRSAALLDPVRSEQQDLLRQYVQERVRFANEIHEAAERESQDQIDILQRRLWAIASSYASDHRDPVTALYLQSLNQSFDAAEERTAEDKNRIPTEAWVMLLVVGVVSTIVVGMRVTSHSMPLQAVLPVVLAATLALTMDLDTPNLGLIRVGQASMDKVAHDMSQRLPQQLP